MPAARGKELLGLHREHEDGAQTSGLEAKIRGNSGLIGRTSQQTSEHVLVPSGRVQPTGPEALGNRVQFALTGQD